MTRSGSVDEEVPPHPESHPLESLGYEDARRHEAELASLYAAPVP